MLCRLFVGSDDKTIMHELTNKDENSCIRGGISFYNADGVGLIRMRRMIMIVVMSATVPVLHSPPEPASRFLRLLRACEKRILRQVLS